MKKPYKIDKLPKDEVVRMYVHDKLNMKDIAEHFDCLTVYVKRVLLSNGVKLRSKAERGRILREKRLADEDLKLDIKRMYYEDRVTLKTISEKHKLSIMTLMHLMKEWEMSPREKLENPKKIFDKLPDAEIIRMYVDKKMSCPDIGQHFGVSPPIILKVLRINNIPRRTLSESKQAWWDRKQQIQQISAYRQKDTIDASVPDDMSIREKVLTLQSRGMLVQDIMKELKITPQEIYDILKS